MRCRSPRALGSSVEAVANRHLSRVLSSNYLEGINDWPDDELRARRGECHQLEEAASYLRRLTQVRLDIIGAELDARRHPNEPTESVVERLTRVLASNATSSGGRGRLMSDEPRDDQEAWAQARIDEASEGVSIEAIGSLSDAGLAALTDGLAALERQVSGERQNLHRVYDAIQAELVQRYKTGRASVDGLLK
jgi:hypothetical protein